MANLPVSMMFDDTEISGEHRKKLPSDLCSPVLPDDEPDETYECKSLGFNSTHQNAIRRSEEVGST